MHIRLKAMASLVLATAVSGQAQVSAKPYTARKAEHHHRRERREVRPNLQTEIDQLRTTMQQQQQQIGTLQQQLATRDAQMQQMQQQAQTAIQQATEQAQSTLAAQQAATQQNTTAVASLQGAVNDLQASHATLAATVKADQTATQKAIQNPDVVHFKGVGLNFTNSFIEFATVDRTKATASDIPTPFSAIPLTASDAGQMSEFYATGRQSRLAISAVGHIPMADLQAYYELDWLGTGVTSNNNQSNSYVMRERQLWAQAALHSGLTITGGQQWTLATETRRGLEEKTEVLPDTIDPNYNVGFVWARQPSLRVVQKMGNAFLGFSVENAQTLTPACQATTATGGSASCPTNYVLGNSGTGAGLYNSTTTYSYNLAPDVIAKFAMDSRYGHAELFGIGRFFRDRVYPAETTANAATGAAAAGAYNDSLVTGGVGGGFRGYMDNKKLELALHGLWGQGVGRYAAAQLGDTTVRPSGQLAPLRNSAALGEVFLHATPRLDIYSDWGFEEVGRRIFSTVIGGYEGYGLRTVSNADCGVQIGPGTTTTGYTPSSTASPCQGENKDATEGTLGYDYYFYKGPAGRFRQGFQYSWVERALWAGSAGLSPKATDEVFETNIRYYLP